MDVWPHPETQGSKTVHNVQLYRLFTVQDILPMGE
jgi:hypothetical protein